MGNTYDRIPSGVRSALAVLAGLVTIFVTHLGTDQILHKLQVFPPWKEPMYDPSLNLLALSYRCIWSVVGCYLTARLAPRAPMAHALTLGLIGTVLSTIAIFATAGMNLGPSWYPIALAVSALPCAWLGGLLHRVLHQAKSKVGVAS
jgi:hypothetical protein